MLKSGEDQNQPRELRLWQHVAIFLLACAVFASRQPDAIFRPGFWAEGGHVFYAEAYQLGWWQPLFRTLTGYFQTLPRLGASLSLLLPLSQAPLLLNCIAIGVQALVVNLLLSGRSSGWGSFRFRAMLAGMLLVLPNCSEVSVRIPNTQWFLGLGALILLLASTPRSKAGHTFDFCLFLLCGLSGPFCFPLLLIAVFVAWKRGGRWRWVNVALFTASCAIQARALLFLDPAARSHKALGANPAEFIRIVGSQIYTATLLGGNGLSSRAGMGMFISLAAVAAVGTAVVAICLYKSGLEMKMFLLFTIILLAASMVSPAGWVPDGVTFWHQLTDAPGMRYWFLPTLAFAWSILFCAHQLNRPLKWAAIFLLCIMSFGVIRDWKHPAFQDTNFSEEARRFEAAPTGTESTFPVSPAGWSMSLVKHSRGQ